MTETAYQKTVNNLTGAMGPVKSAYWKNTGTTMGNTWNMGAQPLFFSPSLGKYVTSYEANAASSIGDVLNAPKGWGVLGTWDPSAFKNGNGFGSKTRFGKCPVCYGFGRSRRFGNCGCNNKRQFGRKRSRKSRKGSRKTRRKSRKGSRKSRRKSRVGNRKSRRKSRKGSRKSRRKSRVGRPKDHNKYKPKRGCTEQTTKKYTTRKSPAYPANLCRTKIKEGNDGDNYKSKRILRKGKAYYRWVKV